MSIRYEMSVSCPHQERDNSLNVARPRVEYIFQGLRDNKIDWVLLSPKRTLIDDITCINLDQVIKILQQSSKK